MEQLLGKRHGQHQPGCQPRLSLAMANSSSAAQTPKLVDEASSCGLTETFTLLLQSGPRIPLRKPPQHQIICS
mgnify:CR=1 FL=1